MFYYDFSIFADAVVQITREEGVAALWSSTFTSLLLVSNPTIQFVIYEGLKRHLRQAVTREVSGKMGEISSRLWVLTCLEIKGA